MRYLICFLALCSTAFCQPPPGTGRSVRNEMGTTHYYSTGGKWLGQSRENTLGGSNFSDGRGMYSKTMKTPRSELQIYKRAEPIPRPKSVQRTHSHTMVSPAGSSTLPPGRYRSK